MYAGSHEIVEPDGELDRDDPLRVPFFRTRI